VWQNPIAKYSILYYYITIVSYAVNGLANRHIREQTPFVSAWVTILFWLGYTWTRCTQTLRSRIITADIKNAKPIYSSRNKQKDANIINLKGGALEDMFQNKVAASGFLSVSPFVFLREKRDKAGHCFRTCWKRILPWLTFERISCFQYWTHVL